MNFYEWTLCVSGIVLAALLAGSAQEDNSDARALAVYGTLIFAAPVIAAIAAAVCAVKYFLF